MRYILTYDPNCDKCHGTGMIYEMREVVGDFIQCILKYCPKCCQFDAIPD